MEKLATQISDVKNEVFESLQKNYVDFYPNLSRGVELSGQLETLSRDVASVTTRVDTEVRGHVQLVLKYSCTAGTQVLMYSTS